MRLAKIALLVKLPDVSPEEIADYVADALGSWGGGGHPDSELFPGIAVHKVTLRGHSFVFKDVP